MTLWYERQGQGENLVLLHGWGMNAGVWQPVLPILQQHYRVTLIELPGHGASAPLAANRLNDWAQACLDVAPEQAHWLGWSLGGLLTIQAALQAPQRVTALSLLTATPRFVQADDWQAAMPTETFQQFSRALNDNPSLTLKRFLSLQVKGSPQTQETLRDLNQALAQRPSASRQGLQVGLELLLKGDLRAHLANLLSPVRVLLGGHDTLVPAAVGEDLLGLLPSIQCQVVASAAHAPFLSHQADFLRWLDIDNAN
jgi:pimeloyl-[acyl-carrier protein] methyl ester esterase